MKKILPGLGLSLILLIAVILAALPAAARSVSFPGACIGGAKCGQATYIITLPDCFIERVEFYADDNIGMSTKGIVSVSVDGQMAATDLDVKKDGYLHIIYLNRYGRTLQILPATDDEVRIHYLNAYCRQ